MGRPTSGESLRRSKSIERHAVRAGANRAGVTGRFPGAASRCDELGGVLRGATHQRQPIRPQFSERFVHLAGQRSMSRSVRWSSIRRAEPSPHYLHPCLTDCITQLLAAFVLENGKTFILRSIERIEIIDVEVPGVLWVSPLGCAIVKTTRGAWSETFGRSTTLANGICSCGASRSLFLTRSTPRRTEFSNLVYRRQFHRGAG